MLEFFSGWKRVVFVIGLIIACTRIVYIFANDEMDKQYYVSKSIDVRGAVEVPCNNIIQEFSTNEKRLNSLEIYFNNIPEDKEGSIELSILKNDIVVYCGKVSLNNIENEGWTKIYLNIPIDVDANYKIVLNALDCSQMPTLCMTYKNNTAPEAGGCLADDVVLDGKLAIKFGYLRESSFADKLFMSAVSGVLLFFLWAMLKYFYLIKHAVSNIYIRSNVKGVPVIGELVLCLVVTKLGGLGLQSMTEIILYAVSIFSMWDIENKVSFIVEFADKVWKKICFCALCAYAAFALVGQRLFIYPLDLKVTAEGVFIFLATLAWFVPVIISCIMALDKLSLLIVNQHNGMKFYRFFGLLLVILIVPPALNLYANNPGITTYDSFVTMLINAKHIRGMQDWHPAFYCMLLRVILNIWDSTYAVILCQYFFWCYVMLEALLYLRKKGISDGMILLTALFIGGNAANFIQINTIWKDIPYTLSLFWTMIICAKLALDFEFYKNKWYIYLELIIALVGLFFYRKNGIVAFAIVVLTLGIVLRKNIKVFCSIIISLALIITIKYPVYNYFEIEDPGRYGMYIGLSQDILGVYYSGGELSENTLLMVNVMTSGNTIEFDYTPTWARQSYGLDVEPTDFILSYLDTFIKNPVLMTRAIIAREDAIWDIFRGKDTVLGCVNLQRTNDGVVVDEINWNDYYPQRKPNNFRVWMAELTAKTASVQWVNAIEWRCGLFTLLTLIALCLIFFKYGVNKYWIIIIPGVGHILGLLLSTGWSDFRYFWPLNLMDVFIIIFALYIMAERNGRGKEE